MISSEEKTSGSSTNKFGKRKKWLVFSPFLIIFFAYYLAASRSKNNVCKTFQDYYTDRDNNENCHYNPDYRLDVSQLIERYGYQAKIYNATTIDGYILTVYRIPPKGNFSDRIPPQPVLLQHGFALNCECFVNIGRKSLAFILADAGYDVWLGNFRGTEHSLKHQTLDANEDVNFWNFTFHEMGAYDIESKLDLIYSETKQKVVVIGFSMGSTASLLYGSTKPEEAAKKFKLLIAMAPVITLKHWGRTIRWALQSVPSFVAPLYQTVVGEAVKMREYIPKTLRQYICLPYPFQMHFCQTFDMIAWGFSYSQSDPETLPITLLGDSDAVSMKTILHTIQLLDGFKHYHYGIEENNKLYGHEDSPHYNLSNFDIPIFVLRSNNDHLSSKDDVERWYSILPDESKKMGIHVVQDESFNHMDFLLAKEVVPLVYTHIIGFLEKFLAGEENS